jgi:hypothetical protein
MKLSRRGPRCSATACYTFLLAVSFLPLILTYLVHFHTLDEYAPLLLTTPSQAKSLRQLSETHGNEVFSYDNKVCPQAQRLYQTNQTALLQLSQETFQQAMAFHTYGGSLKSIQQFLDRQIHPTLERLGVSYRERETKTEKPGTNLKVDDFLHEFFHQHHVKRGGYGQPLPIQFYDKDDTTSIVDKVLHGSSNEGKRWIDVMEEATPERFQVAIGPMAPQCPHMVHFSENEGLEEKSFCIESESVVKPDDDDDSCHIFSIGSNDQWNFETSLRQKLPHCHTHTFDCTLNGPPKHQPKNDGKVHFYPYCVSSGNDEDNTSVRQPRQRKYLSYPELWKATSIQKPPKLLKMDVEGFEFDVLTSMLSSFESSDWWPEQIMMEVHYITRMVDLPWLLRTRQAAELALFFDSLWNAGGYLPIKVQYFGEWCPSCMEILLLRVKC